MKTIKFYTLGCKVNQYDTQSLREDFLRSGFKELTNGEAADNYLINTCTVTARADSESLGLVRRARKENPKARIIVTGCLTELDVGRIEKINKSVLIVQNRDKENILSKIPFLNLRTKELKNQRAKTGISDFHGHTRAFLKIQDGCDNFCSYCKVPLVRGRSRSRPLNEIVSEAMNLVKSGFKEIVLTGICLGAYGKELKPEIGLVKVIDQLEKIGQLLRIRLSSIEAGDISEALIEKFSRSKKLCRHLHIPIQSGDDKILKSMHRRYSRADYLGLIKKIKRRVSGVAITTDVLVGFPGEGQGNFENTLDLVKKILPLKVHIFPYSRREGTSAAQDTSKEVPCHIIRERLLAIKKLADTCAMDYKKQFLGKKMEVLFEEECRDSPGWWQGHTDNYIKTTYKSHLNLKNKFLKIPLT